MQSDHDGAAASGRWWIRVRHQGIDPEPADQESLSGRSQALYRLPGWEDGGTGSQGIRALIRMTAPTSALPHASPAPALRRSARGVGRPCAPSRGAVERGAERTAKVVGHAV